MLRKTLSGIREGIDIGYLFEVVRHLGPEHMLAQKVVNEAFEAEDIPKVKLILSSVQASENKVESLEKSKQRTVSFILRLM